MYKNYNILLTNKDEQVEDEQVEYDINSEYIEMMKKTWIVNMMKR